MPLPALDKTLLDAALNGLDTTPRLVAVETDRDTATLITRHRDGTVARETVPFIPWLIQREERFLPDGEEILLEGDGYNRLVRFPNWRAYLDARQILRDERRDFLQYGSPQKQFLLGTGRTLFKGMAFTEVRRMQIDIETTTFTPTEPGAQIFMIACSDNFGNEELLFGDERELLYSLNHLVATWDPDIIEGHNIYSFDLPWIRARARALNIALPWGRDQSEIGVGNERNCAIGANTRPFVPHFIWGRHVLDTLFQTQRFDGPRGEISSYNLKECARTYHIAEPDRVYIPHDEIASLWRTDPERVKAYTLGDVRETRRLAEIVTPTEFYSTQMVPDVFQSVAVTGSGEKRHAAAWSAYAMPSRAATSSVKP